MPVPFGVLPPRVRWQGVLINAGGTITNGSIDGGTTIVTGALIRGVGNGVQLGGAGGTVTNYVGNTIESTGSAGVFISAGSGLVNNGGTITGTTQGVIFTPSGTVNNIGSITGGTRGVQLNGGGTLNNGSLDGGTTIVAGSIAGTANDGVSLGATGTVNNFLGSTISSSASGSSGVLVSAGNGTIINVGSITGMDQGVQFNSAGDGNVTNSGEIRGTNTTATFGNGIYFSAGNATITNEATGKILGDGRQRHLFVEQHRYRILHRPTKASARTRERSPAKPMESSWVRPGHPVSHGRSTTKEPSVVPSITGCLPYPGWRRSRTRQMLRSKVRPTAFNTAPPPALAVR
ncbi:MAG: hypothetical protein QM755_06330 [Luteolibacter sp.]